MKAEKVVAQVIIILYLLMGKALNRGTLGSREKQNP